MSIFSDLIDCPNLLVNVDQAFSRPGVIQEPLPFLQYVLSNTMREGLSIAMVPGDAHVRTVQVKYVQRLNETTVQANVPNPNCSPGVVYKEMSTTYDMDTSVNFGVGFRWNIKDFQRICGGTPQIIFDMIAKLGDALDRKVATSFANKVVTNHIGNWARDTQNYNGTVVTQPTLNVATKLANGNTDPTLYEVVRRAMAVSGYGSAAVFTDQTLLQYANNALTGCCVNDLGYDLAAQLARYGIVFTWDRRIETALKLLNPDGNGLMVAPGSLAAVSFTQAEWKNGVPLATEGGNYFYTSVFTPAGLKADLTFKDDCGDVVLNMVVTTDIFGMPDDLYSNEDVYSGIVGVNKITVTNPS